MSKGQVLFPQEASPSKMEAWFECFDLGVSVPHLPCAAPMLQRGAAAERRTACALPPAFTERTSVIWHPAGSGSRLQEMLKVGYGLWLFVSRSCWAPCSLFHAALCCKTNKSPTVSTAPFIAQCLIMIQTCLGNPDFLVNFWRTNFYMQISLAL